VIAFGENNLPVPIHGRSRADSPRPDAAGHGGYHRQLTQLRRVAGHRRLIPVPP